jgi:hypothetical protein
MGRLVFILFCSLLFTHVNATGIVDRYKGDARLLPGDTAKKDTIIAVADTDDDKNRQFAFGVEYASDKTHYGLRNTSVKLPYIEPNFTYTAPKGFYIEVSDEYFFYKKIQGFDAFCLNPGWDIDFGDNTTLDINYTHYSIKNSPSIVTAGLNNSLETYVTQWVGHLRGKLAIDYDIYKGSNSPNDFIFTPDLEYKFKWKLGEKSSLKLKPELNIDIGTRNFYTQALISQQNDTIAQKGKLKGKKVQSNSNSSFGTLDYNFILTLDFAIGKFDFEPAFNYTDPLYKPSSTPNPPTAYMTISITYTISTK